MNPILEEFSYRVNKLVSVGFSLYRDQMKTFLFVNKIGFLFRAEEKYVS